MRSPMKVQPLIPSLSQRNVGLTFREILDGVDVPVGKFPINLGQHRRVYRKLVASSIHRHGGIGLACGCQLLAITWPSSWPN